MSDYVFVHHCPYCDAPIREGTAARTRKGKYVHEWCVRGYEMENEMRHDETLDEYMREHGLHKPAKLG